MWGLRGLEGGLKLPNHVHPGVLFLLDVETVLFQKLGSQTCHHSTIIAIPFCASFDRSIIWPFSNGARSLIITVTPLSIPRVGNPYCGGALPSGCPYRFRQHYKLVVHFLATGRFVRLFLFTLVFAFPFFSSLSILPRSVS